MSFIIPSPDQLRTFAEFAFEALTDGSILFYSCCKECGLDHIREEEGHLPFFFMFSSLTDLKHAGETGLLYFHYGILDVERQFQCSMFVGTVLTEALKDQGFDVRWSGDPKDRFSLAVDRISYRLFAEDMERKVKDNKKSDGPHNDIPNDAEVIDSEYTNYLVRIWKTGSLWHYDVSDAADPTHSYERSHQSSRDEAIRDAMEAAEDAHLDVN